MGVFFDPFQWVNGISFL